MKNTKKLLTCCYKHLKTVLKHKAAVFRECRECGIVWQGITHDMSKFSPTEFISSAMYFQGNRSPIDAEKEKKGYSAAWLHHKGRNKHHWEYWTDFDSNGSVVASKIPTKYVIELVCDWIGAGKVYEKEQWNAYAPLQRYLLVRPKMFLHSDTELTIDNAFRHIALYGLESWHKEARRMLSTEKHK